jgi:TonB-linked SusC/RagA family outer membrane protein
MIILMCGYAGWANTPLFQQRTVSGRVTSADDGNGFPGVNILVKGTTVGTVTDSEGNYSVEVPSAEGVLVFSSIGYKTVELPVGTQSVMNLAMEPDITSLAEVVVVGYGTVKKSDVTGSLVSISGAQLQEVPVQSISQSLQGRAAGVDVAQSSFRPGENPTIRIRGNRSIMATNNPLIVMDGIPLSEGSGINDFNPADIQSVEVLKDASAAAIYGSRGANGVILITTKKGRAGKARIDYEGYVGFSEPLAEIDMMTGGQFAELRREAHRNNSSRGYKYPYADPAADFKLFSEQDINMWNSVAQAYDWVDEANRIPEMRPVTAEEMALFQAYYQQDLIRYANDPKILATLVDPSSITQVPDYHPERVRTTDWADLVLQTGKKQSHQVSISGGTEKLGVVFSGGYYDEEGIQKAQSFERFNGRLGLDYQATPAIQIGGTSNVAFSTQQYGSPLYFRAIGQLPLALPYDAAGDVILQPGGDALIFSPLNEISDYMDERRVSRFFGSYYADIKLLEGLRFRTNFGPDFKQYRRGRYYGAFTSDRRGGTSQGIYDQEQRLSYVWENLLYYDKVFGDHTLGLTFLQSAQRERFESSTITVSDLPYRSLVYNLGSTNAAGPDAFGSDYFEKSLMSWMGRVNYGFKNRYLFTVTGRFDGSSTLAPDNKWDFFPSFAFAWKAHEEPFLNGVSFIDELKVRAGYGKVGNAAVEPYTVQGRLLKTRYVWGNTPAWGFNPNWLPNPDLSWEKTASLNAGIDFGLIGGRLSGTVDVYRQTTTDLIMNRLLPTAGGFAEILSNIGSTRNSGVEISLTSVNVDMSNGFKWSTDFIFTKNKEEIVELYSAKNDDIGNRWFIGQPLTTYYGWKPIGVWQSNEVEEAKKYGRIPGQGKFLDKDTDGDIDANDQMIRGSNVPDWSGSIVNNFSYKGVELSVFIYTRQGQVVASGYYRPALAGRYTEPAFIEYWTPGNPTNKYPRPTQDQERIDRPESYLYQDASFTKIRNITLAYTLPESLISRFKFSNLKVYVTAYNPFLFTKFEGGDPEFTAPVTRISDGRTVPITSVNDQLIENNLSERSIVVGIKAGF